MIAFLHTSQAHITRFSELSNNHHLGFEVQHYVNEELLKTALANGKVDEDAFIRQIEFIRNAGIEKIICTCSTLGSVCDKNGVLRIDRPVVEYMVGKYSKIGMVYSTTSTKFVSQELIKDCAKDIGKKVTIESIDCTGCWPDFEKGDKMTYYQGIKERTLKYMHSVDVIFLAQASMENVRGLLENESVEVLTSPEIGVRTLLQGHNN